MKVVILAGGFGTRLAELTGGIPKPMVVVGGKPILWHIMNHYSKFGYKEFVLALGYKAEVIKNYFLNYSTLSTDFTVNLNSGDIDFHDRAGEDWKVTLVDTGLNSMTGGRLGRLRHIRSDDTFMLTYGDGVSNVDINNLVDFHRSKNKIATVTTVRPGARFGELDIVGDDVRFFKEKPQTTQGWVNGGFFVLEPKFLELISSDSTVLEQEPLERVALEGQLNAYKHEGFWQCMDTVRDRDYLNDLWEKGDAPWKN